MTYQSTTWFQTAVTIQTVSIVTPVLNESHSDYTELPKVLANLIHVFIFMKYEIRKHGFYRPLIYHMQNSCK